MKLRSKLVLGLAVLAAGRCCPAMAGLSPTEPGIRTPNTRRRTEDRPKGHAYGYYCRGESKKHVKGEKGTAFSRCVRAHKRAANHAEPDRARSLQGPEEARSTCHKASKGTAFSRCVKAVAQQRKDRSGDGDDELGRLSAES